MTTLMAMGRDMNGYVDYSLEHGDYNIQVKLAALSPFSFTIPSNFKKWRVIFTVDPGASIWVAKNQTALPPTSSPSLNGSIQDPNIRIYNAGDVISVVTTSVVSPGFGAQLYALPNQ